MTPIHPLHPAPHVAVGPATAATHAATVHGSATGKAKHAHPSPPAAGFTREFDQLLQQERQQMSRSLQNQLAADRRLFRSLSRL